MYIFVLHVIVLAVVLFALVLRDAVDAPAQRLPASRHRPAGGGGRVRVEGLVVRHVEELVPRQVPGPQTCWELAGVALAAAGGGAPVAHQSVGLAGPRALVLPLRAVTAYRHLHQMRLQLGSRDELHQLQNRGHCVGGRLGLRGDAGQRLRQQLQDVPVLEQVVDGVDRHAVPLARGGIHSRVLGGSDDNGDQTGEAVQHEHPLHLGRPLRLHRVLLAIADQHCDSVGARLLQYGIQRQDPRRAPKCAQGSEQATAGRDLLVGLPG
mmetsp:Transcript_15553/g.34359  ORF Transcript_15553/g.34359 Transcript_15553/m.34359 type:complete len:266 (+) Transcript_15553:2329-3126(+)